MNKERYWKAKNEGICTNCYKPNDRVGKAICSKCQADKNERQKGDYKFYQSINICPVCRKEVIYGFEKTCLSCKDKSAERKRIEFAKDPDRVRERNRRYLQRKKVECIENKICTHCRRRKTDGIHKTCAVCREKGALRSALYREKILTSQVTIV